MMNNYMAGCCVSEHNYTTLACLINTNSHVWYSLPIIYLILLTTMTAQSGSILHANTQLSVATVPVSVGILQPVNTLYFHKISAIINEPHFTWERTQRSHGSWYIRDHHLHCKVLQASAFLLNKCQRHRYQKFAPKTGTGFCRVWHEV